MATNQTMTLNLQSFLTEMFAYENVNIRIVGTSDTPWFCGKDVCDVLGYTFYRDALKTHVDADCKCSLKAIIRQYNRKTTSNEAVCDSHTTSLSHNEGLACYVNEEGLYTLILSSKLPSAKLFRKWVTKDVLPAIRKEGIYKLEQTIKEYEEKLVESTKALAVKDEALASKDEALASKDEALASKDEALASKDKVIAKNELVSLHMNRIMNTMKLRCKEQRVYIATTRVYAAQNRFKVGGVKSERHLRTRLATYNTGRPKEDRMYYCYVWECVNYHHLEQRLDHLYGDFKDTKEAEMYVMHYDDLKNRVDRVTNNYTNETDEYNETFDDIVNNLANKPPVTPEPFIIDGAAYVRIRNGKLQTNKPLATIDWNEMDDDSKLDFVRRVSVDYLTTLPHSNDANAQQKIVYRKDVERHAEQKYGAKFKRNTFWLFIKNALTQNGIVVKYNK